MILCILVFVTVSKWTLKNPFTNLNLIRVLSRSSDNKTVDTTHFQIYENIDFEAHLGTKIDYLHFNNLRQLLISLLELLRNDYELERSTNLNTLMISHENTRLAGYTLTRNRSVFIKTNGNVA